MSLTNGQDERISKNLTIKIKKFNFLIQLFLKEKFEFRGGGSSALIQGSGKKVDIDLQKEIENWIKTI